MVSLFGWLCLTTLASCAAQAQVQRPPIVQPEKGAPKDKNNCRISIASVAPWLVAVWDTNEKLNVGHGSMLTYIVFITTCRQYSKAASQYQAHAQFLWNIETPFDPCMQPKDVESIFKHPRCTESKSDWTPFDVAIFRLKQPFDIYGSSYPTVGLSNIQDQLQEGVKFINTYDVTNTTGCFLPAFRRQEELIPVFNFNAPFVMQVIPFKDKCLKLLCEMQPADASASTACEGQFKEDLDTYLCMKNKSNSAIQLGKDNSYWLAGAPLYCNGTVYGMAARPKIRKGFSADSTDFHFIVPFSHVWQWIVEHTSQNSAPWVVNVYIDSKMRFIVHENNGTTEYYKGGTYAVTPTLSTIGTLVCLLATVNRYLEHVSGKILSTTNL